MLPNFLLNPALLWFLPLALVPVVLHLLTLHRLRTVELSTFRFLFDSYVQQRRRMQFLEALLAMLRVLFVLGLIAALSRPVMKHFGSLFRAGSGRDVVLLVDCSASMDAASGGQTSLERAKEAAKAVVGKLDREDRVTLVKVTAKPEELFSRFTSDAAQVQDRIDSLKATPARANWFAAMMHVFGPESSHKGQPLVYIFTDAQASGFREIKSQGLDRFIPAGTPMVVVQTGSREPISNVAVTGDPPPRQRAIVGLPISLQARVVNHSKSETADVTLNVLVDEKEVARTRLALKPGETATRRFIYQPNEAGMKRGRYEITVAGNADAYPDDNRYLFSLPVLPRLKLLLVNGNPAADPLDSETLYLRAALSRSSAAADKVATGVDVSAFDVRDMPETAVNPETLRDAGVVVLANCGGLDAQRLAWLRDYVSTGGGLLIFPGDKVNVDVYNSQFFPVPGPQKEELTAARLGPAVGDPEKLETFERVGAADLSHPVLTVFDDPQAQFFKEVRFKRRYPITLPESKANVWPLFEYADGKPAMVESRFGDGLVVLAGFPANAKWTNFPSQCAREFVPLVLRLVGHVQHRPETDAPAAVAADGVAEVSVAPSWMPATGKVTDALGRPTTLAFERSGTRYVAAFEGTGERGYYTVEVQGGGAGAAKAASHVFAVNMAPEESDFASASEQNLRELLPTAELSYVDASADAPPENIRGSEQEVWRPLLYLMFLVIGVELFIATFGGGRRQVVDESSE